MKKSNWQPVWVLAVGALLSAVGVQAKESLSRPFKIHVQSQQVWQLDETGAPVQMLSAEGWGVASHCGLIYTVMTGPTTGLIVAANHDQIYFDYVYPSPDVTIVGGTGRFDGAAGGFSMTIFSNEVSIDPLAGTMTICLTWTGSGTISYPCNWGY